MRRLQYSAKLQEKKLRNNIWGVTYRFVKISFHDKNDCANQDRLATIIFILMFCSADSFKTGTVLVNCIN